MIDHLSLLVVVIKTIHQTTEEKTTDKTMFLIFMLKICLS